MDRCDFCLVFTPLHPQRPGLQHMRVDHGRADIGVTEQFHTVRISASDCRRCVAKLWRNVCVRRWVPCVRTNKEAKPNRNQRQDLHHAIAERSPSLQAHLQSRFLAAPSHDASLPCHHNQLPRFNIDVFNRQTQTLIVAQIYYWIDKCPSCIAPY